MLVLTRKQQERIHIGENITITVVRIKGNTVRVGIEAPRDVRVMRGEVNAKDAPTEECGELTTGTDQAGAGERKPDTGSEETIDKPSTPWQSGRSARRGPLPVPGRVARSGDRPQRDSVPTHAV